MVHLVGSSRQTPWSPRGEGWPNCIKKHSNKKIKKSHRECQKTYIESVTQINTAEQPELSLIAAHRNYWIICSSELLIRKFWAGWPSMWPAISAVTRVQPGIPSLVEVKGRGRQGLNLDKSRQGGGGDVLTWVRQGNHTWHTWHTK